MKNLTKISESKFVNINVTKDSKGRLVNISGHTHATYYDRRMGGMVAVGMILPKDECMWYYKNEKPLKIKE